jgi:hypothetical protein
MIVSELLRGGVHTKQFETMGVVVGGRLKQRLAVLLLRLRKRLRRLWRLRTALEERCWAVFALTGRSPAARSTRNGTITTNFPAPTLIASRSRPSSPPRWTEIHTSQPYRLRCCCEGLRDTENWYSGWCGHCVVLQSSPLTNREDGPR